MRPKEEILKDYNELPESQFSYKHKLFLEVLVDIRDNLDLIASVLEDKEYR